MAEETVGAHEFRNHFGWYMQRAAAGASFKVTRRGKPYVKLVPGSDSLLSNSSQITVIESTENAA